MLPALVWTLDVIDALKKLRQKMATKSCPSTFGDRKLSFGIPDHVPNDPSKILFAVINAN